MTAIPTFDGREVDAARLAFSGSVDDSARIIEPDDEVALVVRARCTGVRFAVNQFGVLRRVHSLKIDHAIDADGDLAAAVFSAPHDPAQTSIDDAIDAAALETPDA